MKLKFPYYLNISAVYIIIKYIDLKHMHLKENALSMWRPMKTFLCLQILNWLNSYSQILKGIPV